MGGIPQDVDPNARTKCPECKALTLAADWREHAEWHAALTRRLDDVDAGLLQPAPEPDLIDWPAGEPATETASLPAGPYSPEPAGDPAL